MNIRSCALALALAPAASGAAYADTTIFDVTGVDGSYTFDLPTTPVPDSVVSGCCFVIDGYQFYGGYGGGWNQYYGAQLYTGPESSPMFVTGSFSVFDSDTGNFDDVTLTSTSTAVPEPATWAVMGLGFVGLVFVRVRQAKRRVSAGAWFGKQA